ncbi:hypothetical protein CEUSTIGMA_g11908.t1 [Chlamydomonas eustigma]|uniref:Uncharacterized protein n=1 Tax=Chlamydomonas eustigma TaxID=1157962 RepID=A0A250XN41_9CHLO|nr:hypothetical protein CEUSTIGMA_g11908.t1 [Chlamydomonas eustigma]|eukprot:GAX84488.1 hypothetical protein CEUSTIGMA_g11908.t1 [Chlamydomonas eustigma]
MRAHEQIRSVRFHHPTGVTVDPWAQIVPLPLAQLRELQALDEEGLPVTAIGSTDGVLHLEDRPQPGTPLVQRGPQDFAAVYDERRPERRQVREHVLHALRSGVGQVRELIQDPLGQVRVLDRGRAVGRRQVASADDDDVVFLILQGGAVVSQSVRHVDAEPVQDVTSNQRAEHPPERRHSDVARSPQHSLVENRQRVLSAPFHRGTEESPDGKEHQSTVELQEPHELRWRPRVFLLAARLEVHKASHETRRGPDETALPLLMLRRRRRDRTCRQTWGGRRLQASKSTDVVVVTDGHLGRVRGQHDRRPQGAGHGAEERQAVHPEGPAVPGLHARSRGAGFTTGDASVAARRLSGPDADARAEYDHVRHADLEDGARPPVGGQRRRGREVDAVPPRVRNGAGGSRHREPEDHVRDGREHGGEPRAGRVEQRHRVGTAVKNVALIKEMSAEAALYLVRLRENAPMANDMLRMVSIQLAIQVMMALSGSGDQRILSAEFLLLVLYILLGVALYWLAHVSDDRSFHLRAAVATVNDRLRRLSNGAAEGSPIHALARGVGPWKIAVFDDAVEDGLPHTHGDVICLPASLVSEGREQRALAQTLAHERVHVLQRARPELFDTLYARLWRLRRVPRPILRDDDPFRSNPDLDAYDYGPSDDDRVVKAMYATDPPNLRSSVLVAVSDDGRDVRETTAAYEHPHEAAAHMLAERVLFPSAPATASDDGIGALTMWLFNRR